MQSDVFSWSIFKAGTNLILISVHQKSNVTELLVMLAIGCVEPERVFLIIWIHGLSLAVVVQDHIFSSHGGYMIVCVFPILWLIYIHRISSKAKNRRKCCHSFHLALDLLVETKKGTSKSEAETCLSGCSTHLLLQQLLRGNFLH